MNDQFKIYIDRIKDGSLLNIQETVPPSFLDIHERDLSFSSPVVITGQASIAGDQLVIKLSIQTEASLPCAICNDRTPFPVAIQDFYHMEQIEDLKSPIFDFTEALREAILLTLPQFTECHGGNCPDRKEINKYLANTPPKGSDTPKKPDCYYPFGNLSS
jgi:hypothetical protein